MDTTPSFPSPPVWSVQLGDFGKASVILAAAAFIVAALIAFTPLAKGKARKWMVGSMILGCLGLFASFASLATLFINNRFEYEYVWSHSDLRNAVAYRLAAVWSGQQGSFLLWAVCSAVFAMLTLKAVAGPLQRWYVGVYSLFLAALACILAYETPFKLVELSGRSFVPEDGNGLAPALQNYWVVIHPPVIFLGFGSLTVMFALAAAAMLERNWDDWVPIVRPWAMISLSLVGMGLCMGGFWAYETLGWGGFWMWDPVENASFVPWCLTAALVHGLIVQNTRKRWKASNLLFGGAPFLSFLYGTYLTRSGVLSDSSVHSFAEMNRSALGILIGVLAVLILGFGGLWVKRAIEIRKAAPAVDEIKGFHREGLYRWGSILLTGMAWLTLFGMSLPMFMALSGKKPVAVEERVYHMVLPWVFVPIMLVMAIAPLVPWKGQRLKETLGTFYTLLCVVVGILGFAVLALSLTPFGKVTNLSTKVAFPGGLSVPGMPWVLFLVGLCLFVLAGSFIRAWEVRRGSKLGWAPFITHGGVALLMIGLIVSRGFERKDSLNVMENHPGQIFGYDVQLLGMTSNMKDRDNQLRLSLKDAAGHSFEARPGLYMADMNGQEAPMSWPAIQRFGLHDLYITVNAPQKEMGDPFQLKVGETKDFGGFTLTYKEMNRVGEPGKAGTRFEAVLISNLGGKKTEIRPAMVLGASGPTMEAGKLDEMMELGLVGMDAASRAVTLVPQASKPMYHMEVFEKPLTILVWVGTGVMSFGGFLSAFYRRRAAVSSRAGAKAAPRAEPADPDLATAS